MNEETRKNIPSEPELQNSELNEEQLDEVTGGIITIRLFSAKGITQKTGDNRRCAANPSHVYYARTPDDVCPFCGSKEFRSMGN